MAGVEDEAYEVRMDYWLDQGKDHEKRGETVGWIRGRSVGSEEGQLVGLEEEV